MLTVEEFYKNDEYKSFLSLFGALSKIFSDSDAPYIHYRIVENLFCKCFKAENLARSDTSYDAKFGKLGVGLKTFVMPNSLMSSQKIAEFDKLSSTLRSKTTEEIVYTVAKWRNDRIDFADSLHGIRPNESFYHIVGRQKEQLILFNAPYEKIDINSINQISSSDSLKSVFFKDNFNEYSFNLSKSTLFKKFKVSQDRCRIIPISILDDPYELLKKLFNNEVTETFNTSGTYSHGEFVVLPLYSTRTGQVPDKSGLNQWNAGGRPRHPDEVYIPIPVEIRNKFPNFFPDREHSFNLNLPDGKVLSAKVCQENGKALMSNPNADLGKWILRDVFKLKHGEILTSDRLDILGINSVIIYKLNSNKYKLDLTYENYADFIQGV